MTPFSLFDLELQRLLSIPKHGHKHLQKWFLEELYINRKLGIKKIGNLLNCNPVTVWNNLNKAKIVTRDRSFYCIGEKNYFYGKIMNHGHSEETKRKIGLGNKNKKRPFLSERNRNDKEFIEKRLKALMKKPTKPEQKVIEIINKNKLPFTYSGNGQKIIGNRCPDFIHSKGKKLVIEVFGIVFHHPKHTFIKNLSYGKTKRGTKEYYKRQGYNCLVLWDNEINQQEKTTTKIQEYLNKNQSLEFEVKRIRNNNGAGKK